MLIGETEFAPDEIAALTNPNLDDPQAV